MTKDDFPQPNLAESYPSKLPHLSPESMGRDKTSSVTVHANMKQIPNPGGMINPLEMFLLFIYYGSHLRIWS